MNKLQHLQYLNFRKPSRYADNITAIQARPSLDLNFASNKSLIDNVTGNNLITFTRASSGTYVDSAGVLQRAVVNSIQNNTMVGAVTGTPGTLPTTWLGTGITALVTRTIVGTGVENGINYIDLQYTSSAGATIAVQFAAGTQIAASTGQTWTSSAYVKLVGGSMTNISETRIAISENNSGGSFLAGNTNQFTATGDALDTQRYSHTRALTNASTAFVITAVQIVATGAANITLRIGMPQLELGASVTSLIPTTNAINSAPRFDHNPTTGESLGLLVEEQRTNGIRNNTMVGAVAGTPGTLPTNSSISGGGIGTLTQEVVAIGTSNGIAYIDVKYSGTSSNTGFRIFHEAAGQIAASTGQAWTGSAYAAILPGSTGLTSVNVAINERNLANAIVNIQSGSSYSTVSLTMTRLSTTITSASATTVSVQPELNIVFPNTTAVDFTLRIGLPQLEQGAFATSPIPTTTAAVTRSADVASITGSNFSSWYRQDEGTVFAGWSYPVTPSSFPRIGQFTEGAAGTENSFGISTNLFNHNRFGIKAQNVALFDTQVAPDATVNQSMRSGMALKAGQHACVSNGAAPFTNTGAMSSGIDRCYIGSVNGTLFLTGHIRRLTYWPTRISNANLQRITQ